MIEKSPSRRCLCFVINANKRLKEPGAQCKAFAGKQPEVAALQDLLLYTLMGLSQVAVEGRRNRVKVVYPYEHGNPPVGIIKETAENVLQANSDIDKTKIQVSVDSGIVTLRGTVQWYWQLQRAEELLANIIGVVDISNELIVVPSENITDEKIAEQIVDELADSDLVNLDQLLIKVEKGIVFLSGTVKGYAAESEVYDATIQQPGVKQVQNNILVAMTDQ
jgi:osmotically-inducible protein OsmY